MGWHNNTCPAECLLSRLRGLETSHYWGGSDGVASVRDRVLSGPSSLAHQPLIPPRAGVFHRSFEGYPQLPRITSSIFGGLRVARKDKGGTFQRKELKEGRIQKKNEKWLKFHSLCL